MMVVVKEGEQTTATANAGVLRFAQNDKAFLPLKHFYKAFLLLKHLQSFLTSKHFYKAFLPLKHFVDLP
jgi:hypothetical protein